MIHYVYGYINGTLKNERWAIQWNEYGGCQQAIRIPIPRDFRFILDSSTPVQDSTYDVEVWEHVIYRNLHRDLHYYMQPQVLATLRSNEYQYGGR